MKNVLEAGSERTGLLIDGVVGTPYVVGTLSHQLPGTVVASIPFLRGDEPQFKSVQKWFDYNNSSLPENLLFEDEKGSLSLYGIRTLHASIGGGVSLGRFSPKAVVLARTEGDLNEPLRVQAFRSKIDGLADWVDTQAISVETQSDEEGRLTGVDVSVRSPKDIEWTQGDARMSLAVHWNWSGGRELKIEEYVLLQSSFRDRKGLPDEHLDQHRVVRTLLTILSGQAVYYRNHWVRDEQFPRRMLDGTVADIPWQELLYERTLEEHHKSTPTKPRINEVIARFEELGTAGLESWSDIYTLWRRPVDVLTGLLEKSGGFIEDRVLAASMAIESCGHLLGPVAGEPPYKGRNVPFANQVFRCLKSSGLVSDKIASSDSDLALAAAKVYRQIKHPEHEMPDFVHSWLISKTLVLLARLTIAKQIPTATQAVAKFLTNGSLRSLVDAFNTNGVTVGPGGSFETLPPRNVAE